jgi:hypothetical protein
MLSGITVTYYADQRDRTYQRPSMAVFATLAEAAGFTSRIPASDLVSIIDGGGQVVSSSYRRFYATADVFTDTRLDERFDQPLAAFRAELARARLDTNGRGTATAWLGDSLTESFAPSARGLRWIEHLTNRLSAGYRVNGARVTYVPASAGVFSTVNAASWPGSEAPWTYSPTPTGLVTYGADLHAVTVPTGGTATLTYFGDIVNLIYVRTPTGPAAATVAIDGVQIGTFNANGTELPSQVFTSVPVSGIGDYGAHTLVITAVGAPLVLEGAFVYDATKVALGIPFNTVQCHCFGHAGFGAVDFAALANWPNSLATVARNFDQPASLVGIAFGANDSLAKVSAAVYGASLVTIADRIDQAFRDVVGPTTRAGGFLLVEMPGIPRSYVEAAWDAAAAIGVERAVVLDLAEFLPDGGVSWGLLTATGDTHPGDGGQLWVADTIAEAIDPNRVERPVMPVGGPIIEATDEPLRRSNWAASFSATNAGTIDSTAADTNVHERRHRVWLEPGTYVPRIRNVATATSATAEVLVGSTSAGTTATGTSSGNAIEAALSSIVIKSPGWYPVTIRKTATGAGALQFSRLHLRKTA